LATNQPTILQIIPQLDTGGAELSTIEIADAVVRAGGHALVLTEGGRLLPRLEQTGAHILRFPAATKNPTKIITNAYAMQRIIAEHDVDLVHARSRAPAWSALLAARRAGKPFVTTYHGAYSERGRLKSTYNSVMARGDVVIANSQYTSALIQQRYQTPASRIRVIYRGVDGSAFDPDAVPPARIALLRQRWHVTDDQRVILHAARLTGWKGQSVVIAAAKRLLDRGLLANTVIVLAGDAQGRDGYREQLLHEIDRAGLSGRVRIVGHVDDMPAAFLASHLAVVASIGPEAFGRAATEAQVMGCPVISTDIGAPPETVRAEPVVDRSQRTGWLVPPGDPERLATTIAEALQLSADERRMLGQRARAHVLAAFSLDKMRRQTLAVYDGLLRSSLVQCYETAQNAGIP
jgi:glycosyltransferase involved in cell wall biosynthesis